MERRKRVPTERIVESYKQTLSAYKTAEALGINWKTVYDALARAGIAATGLHHYRKTAKRFPDEIEATILQSYESGESIPALAQRHKASSSSIRGAILRLGGKIRPPRGRPSKLTDDEKREICERYCNGMALTALAHLYKTSVETLRGILTQNGIERRQKRRNQSRGRYLHGSGYVFVVVSPDDPFACMARSKGRVVEHRLVMARKLGRPLLDTETVHHIDGDKINNHPENLELRQGKHGKHIALCCLDCGSQNIGPVPFSN